MGSNVPSIEPIFTHSKRSQMELSKALATLGFGAWSELEPEVGKSSGKGLRDRLNTALNTKLEEVERKREKAILLDKKIAKLGDGAERRKLIYQRQQQQDYNRKHRKSPIDEERAAHESYQLLLKEGDMRRLRKEREEEKRKEASQSVSSGGEIVDIGPMPVRSKSLKKPRRTSVSDAPKGPRRSKGDSVSEDFEDLTLADLVMEDSVF